VKKRGWFPSKQAALKLYRRKYRHAVIRRRYAKDLWQSSFRKVLQVTIKVRLIQNYGLACMVNFRNIQFIAVESWG